MSLLEVDALEAGYDDALVLRGVSLRADAHEIVAVIGPNGAGKSTLLKAVYGLITRRAAVPDATYYNFQLQAELGLKAAREREQLSARTYAAFAERARHELASCPQCHQPLRGSDLLVSGHCRNCDNALTSLLVPTRIGSLVVNEYSALLGALGVLAGLAMATSAEDAA